MFGTIQGKLKTPAVGTLILAFISHVRHRAGQQCGSISNVLANLISDIGVLIAFYYGVTGRDLRLGLPQGRLPSRRGSSSPGSCCPLVGGHRSPPVVGYERDQDRRAGAVPTPTSSPSPMGVPLVILARLTTKGDFFKTKPIAYAEIGE